MDIPNAEHAAGASLSWRKVFIAAATGFSLFASSVQPVMASDQNGQVTKVAFANTRFLFWLSGARTGTRPGCDCCSRWEIPVSDANSQARMSVILTAYAQGKSITLSGTGTCVAGANDTEAVSYFEVN